MVISVENYILKRAVLIKLLQLFQPLATVQKLYGLTEDKSVTQAFEAMLFHSKCYLSGHKSTRSFWKHEIFWKCSLLGE